MCAPPVPMGWSGLVTLYNGAGPAPACPGAYPTLAFDLNGGLNAPPAMCGCTCGAVSGATCNASYSVYTNSNCGTLCNTFTVSSCVSTSSCNNGNSVRATATASGGSCTPNPTKSVPGVTWSSVGRGCGGATPTAGCMNGAQCVPTPTGSFSRVCVTKAGDETCPSDYPLKNSLYSGVSDSRDCSTCTCGSPTNVTCSGGVAGIYDAPSCSGSSTTVPVDGACHSASGITTISAKFTTAPAPSGGSCAPSGGNATGQAAGTGRLTVCCR